VAADGGTALSPGNPTLAKLISALQSYSNPLIPVTAVSFMETLFGFSADVKYDPSYDQPAVQAAIWQTLVTEFSFAKRTFGQGVSADEIATVIQGVAGVIAVNVTGLTPLQSSTGGDLANLSGGFTHVDGAAGAQRPEAQFRHHRPHLPVHPRGQHAGRAAARRDSRPQS
jgi:hypothetical protein